MECRKPQKRKNLRLLILTANLSKPGHDVAGLFFCLASAEGAGLLFCPDAIQTHASIYSVFCAVHAFILSSMQNSAHGFTRVFLSICHIPAHTIQQPHKPPIYRLRHAGGHTIKRSTSTNTRYHRRAGHCTGQHSRPIIIMYIRVQHTADHASPAGSRCFPRPAGQSSSRGAAGGAEPLTASAVSLFGLSPDSQ